MDERFIFQQLNTTLTNLRREIVSTLDGKEIAMNVNVYSLENSKQMISPERIKMSESTISSHSRLGESLVGKHVLIFTMDSIDSYEKNSLSGGAAGPHSTLCFLSCSKTCFRLIDR